MNLKDGFFDSTTNSHNGIISPIAKEDKCRILRAYMNARLLLFPKMYLADSDINNNGALRHLIVPTKDKEYMSKNPDLPCDYAELIKSGCIVATVRDDVELGNFSSTLFEIQKHSKHIDLPSERYTKIIQELFKSPNANLTQFKSNDVADIFKSKAEKLLNQNHFEHKDMDKVRRRLAVDIKNMSTINLNELLIQIESYGFPKETPVYEDLKQILSDECYSNNIAQSLNLNYQSMVGNAHPPLNYDDNQLMFEYSVPQTCIFDIDCLAYLPVEKLLEFSKLSERYKFINQFNLFSSGSVKTPDALFSASERYFRQLNKNFEEYYNRHKFKRPEKLLHIRFLETALGHLFSIGLSRIAGEVFSDNNAIVEALSPAIGHTVANLIFNFNRNKKVKTQKSLEEKLKSRSANSVIFSKDTPN